MMKTIYKKDIINKLFLKLNKQVEKSIIEEIISSMIDFIISEIDNDRDVSVKNFGTLSSYLYQSHCSVNINTKIRRMTKAFKNVRLHPHVSFRSLLSANRDSFK